MLELAEAVLLVWPMAGKGVVQEQEREHGVENGGGLVGAAGNHDEAGTDVLVIGAHGSPGKAQASC